MSFAINTEHNGINLTLAGQWQDLAAYYRGDDGSAWTFSTCTNSWSNEGDWESFMAHFSTRRRGTLNPEIEKG